MTTEAKQKLELLNKLVTLMIKDGSLPRDLQLTFEEIKDYIIRNQR